MTHLNLLYSWEFLRKSGRLLRLVDRDLEAGTTVLIDSGAYSERSRKLAGKAPQITCESYIAACHQHFHGRVWKYVALDVIGDPVGTDANLQAMLAAGLQPMPVFVQGHPFERAAELISECGDPWLCVGGGVFARLNYIAHRYQMVTKATDGKAKIHALGFVRWPEMFQLDLASVDCSTWGVGTRFGQIKEYTRTRGMEIILQIRTNTQPGWENGRGNARMASVAARCNIPAELLLDRRTMFGSFGPGSLVTVNSYLDLTDHCAELGIKFFFVVASELDHSIILAVDRCRLGNGAFDYPRAAALAKEGIK